MVGLGCQPRGLEEERAGQMDKTTAKVQGGDARSEPHESYEVERRGQP